MNKEIYIRTRNVFDLAKLLNIDRLNRLNRQMIINFNSSQLNDSSIILLSNLCFINVKSLYLTNNSITDFGMERLMKNDLPHLIQLRASQNRIKISCITILRRKFNQTFLNNNLITGISLKGIVQHQIKLPKFIYLSFNKIGNVGIKLLIKTDMSELQYAQLDHKEIGSEGQKHLIKANFYCLKRITLVQEKRSSPNQFLNEYNLCQNIVCLCMEIEATNILNLAVFKNASSFKLFPYYSNTQLKNKLKEVFQTVQ